MKQQTPLSFSIHSCTSEDSQFPCRNLLHKDVFWQSARFCSYPQQMTLKFPSSTHIQRIQFLGHRCMIPTRIDILYLDPNSKINDTFSKYGYVRFSSNEETQYEAREQKTLEVDFHCTYLRLLFYQPHKNRLNYFSQVGLEEINAFGGDSGSARASGTTPQLKESIVSQTSLQDSPFEDNYINSKLSMLEELKMQTASQERYEEAQRLKEIISNIQGLQKEVSIMALKKKNAVEVENYDEAKRIKLEIGRIKRSTEQIIKSYLEGESVLIEDKSVKEEIEDNDNDDRQDLNEFVEGMVFGESMDSRKSAQSKRSNKEFNDPADKRDWRDDKEARDGKSKEIFPVKEISSHKEIINYDERVIPTLLHKDKTKVEDEETGEEIKLPVEPEAISVKDYKYQHISNVFGDMTARKFSSRHWQFRLEALNLMTQQLNSQKQTTAEDFAMRSETYLEVVLEGMKSNNFQICQKTMELALVILNNKSVQQVKVESLHDNILHEVTKRLTDGNPKIKAMADELFKAMAASPWFGVPVCSTILIKTISPSSKSPPSHILQRLQALTFLVTQYGLGHGNVGYSSIDFAMSSIQHPMPKIRNASVEFLISCWLVGGSEKVKLALDRCRPELSEYLYKRIIQAEKANEKANEKTDQKVVVKQKTVVREKGASNKK